MNSENRTDVKLIATSTVQTAKAARYMKALCNHFDRKATAAYEGNQGHITLSAGHCALRAEEATLFLRVEASDEENCTRMQNVIGKHLERFSGEDSLQVTWTIQAGNS